MAGRFAYILVAGAALVGGMYFQGDLKFNDRDGRVVTALKDGERQLDRRIDRIVDRETGKIERRGDDLEPATKRALAEAVAELVRAEGSLVAVRLDDEIPAGAVKQAEQRRDLARQAVDRLAEDARVKTRERDELRESIRDQIRDSVRS